MRVTFVSNYMNHHQIPFSNEMYQQLGMDYSFVQTRPMEEERQNMGWQERDDLPYVHRLYEEEELCRKLIMDSDCVIAGWSEEEALIQQRLNVGKLTFRVSERIYREGQWKAISPKGLFYKYKEHIRYRNKPVYLLCAGAYVASDFHLIHAYPDKMLKFGYFPELRTYSKEELFAKKPKDRVHLIFAGRFIPLKHPEYMVWLAADLQKSFPQQPFQIHMAGGGEMEGDLKQMAKDLQVEESMIFYGFQSPDRVRDLMEKCHIHLFPSNHLEGWGAVVNEAMNSGCVVVANGEAGAVPYLITHGENGFIYRGTYEEFRKQVFELMDKESIRQQVAQKAYDTIKTYWNAEYAARELLRVIQEYEDGKGLNPSDHGPLSKAPILHLSMKKTGEDSSGKRKTNHY